MRTLYLTIALAGLTLAAAAADAPRPNILLILSDDQGYADTGFMGSKEIRTPNLDRLAEQGTVLTSYYVQPVCSPTRAALMTGRWAVRTGVYSIVRPGAPWGLKLEERTLAAALREAGYETAIVGKWHLGEFEAAYRPTQRGFDHQYGHWFGAIDYFTHERDGKVDWHRDDQPCADKGYSTHLLAEEACRIIRAQPPGKPLFLYLPFNAVHAPHQIPESYAKPFDSLRGVRRTYAGMVAAMDEAVGRVIDALKQQGLIENTLVIFSSDNGGPSPGRVTSNGPLRAGKGTIYEGGVRACAFACWPGRIPAGRRLDEPLHAVDWFPTLVKLAGGAPDTRLPLDGRDIWPTLTAGATSPHEAILLCGTRPGRVALRMGEWKLLLGAGERADDDGAGGAAPPGGVELYRLSDDIGERNNLAAAQPEKVRAMKARLERLLEGAVPSGDAGAAATGGAAGRRRK